MTSGWQDRPATEPQIKAIYAIARGAQAMDDGTLEDWCRERFGVPPFELSRRQASEAIDAMRLGAMTVTTQQQRPQRPWGNVIPQNQPQQAIVPTNQMPQNARPLGPIAAEARAVGAGEDGAPAFLGPEAKRQWIDRGEVFYITDAAYDPNGRFGAEWVLTLLPYEGPSVRLSFRDIGKGTRDELIARIAETVAEAPVGPCRLIQPIPNNDFVTLTEA